MDYVLPNELVDGMIAAGGKKSSVSIKNLLLRGFYSGSALGLALCLALTIMVQTGIPWIGSFIFPFGFASIVLFGMELVTGNFALLPMAVWAGRTTWSKTFRNWIWVWIGNFLGTADLATGSGDWVEVANKIIGLNKANVITKYQDLGLLGFLAFFVA